MWDGEDGLVTHEVVVEQQVEVDGAGAPAYRTHAPQRCLDGQQLAKQIIRRQGCA